MSGSRSAAVESITRSESSRSGGGMAGLGAGRQHQRVEGDFGDFAGALDVEAGWVAQPSVALGVADAPLPAEQSESAGQLADRGVFPVAQRVQIDLRRSELNAPLGGGVGLADQPRHMQQRFGGDAAVVEADAAGVGRGVDQGHVQAALGGEKSGRVAARSGAEHGDAQRVGGLGGGGGHRG